MCCIELHLHDGQLHPALLRGKPNLKGASWLKRAETIGVICVSCPASSVPDELVR